MSTVPAALAVVDAFEASAPPQVAWKLDRTQTVQRIRALVNQPDLLDQRGLNACGPAIFFRVWFARDPVAAAQFSCSLLRDGTAFIGSLSITPSQRLLAQDYATLRSTTNSAHGNVTPEHADWMLLSALRDSENVWFDYLGEPYTVADSVAGLTLPSTVAGWLSATNLYTAIENDTNVVFTGDRQKLFGLIPTSNVDIIWLVNASAIYDLFPTVPTTSPPAGAWLAVPNHYVLMTAPAAQWSDPSWMNIECWTWGRIHRGWQGTDRFFSNYFGVVIPTA